MLQCSTCLRFSTHTSTLSAAQLQSANWLPHVYEIRSDKSLDFSSFSLPLNFHSLKNVSPNELWIVKCKQNLQQLEKVSKLKYRRALFWPYFNIIYIIFVQPLAICVGWRMQTIACAHSKAFLLLCTCVQTHWYHFCQSRIPQAKDCQRWVRFAFCFACCRSRLVVRILRNIYIIIYWQYLGHQWWPVWVNEMLY